MKVLILIKIHSPNYNEQCGKQNLPCTGEIVPEHTKRPKKVFRNTQIGPNWPKMCSGTTLVPIAVPVQVFLVLIVPAWPGSDWRHVLVVMCYLIATSVVYQ